MSGLQWNHAEDVRVSTIERVAPASDFTARFEESAKRLGRFRLERISKAVEAFLECGDYTRGLAKITCTNPECDEEYFRPLAGCRAEPCGRPFSCKVFHLCPSCSQKRTLLFGEYMMLSTGAPFLPFGRSPSCGSSYH